MDEKIDFPSAVWFKDVTVYSSDDSNSTRSRQIVPAVMFWIFNKESSLQPSTKSRLTYSRFQKDFVSLRVVKLRSHVQRLQDLKLEELPEAEREASWWNVVDFAN